MHVGRIQLCEVMDHPSHFLLCLPPSAVYNISIHHVSHNASVYPTPSSGKTYVFLIQKHLLLRNYCLWHSDCVVNIKDTTLLAYNNF